jgi:hypothetical protein
VLITGDTALMLRERHLSTKTGDLLIAEISFGSFPSVFTGSPILKGADRDILPLRIAAAELNAPPAADTALIFSVRSFYYLFGYFIFKILFYLFSVCFRVTYFNFTGIYFGVYIASVKDSSLLYLFFISSFDR